MVPPRGPRVDDRSPARPAPAIHIIARAFICSKANASSYRARAARSTIRSRCSSRPGRLAAEAISRHRGLMRSTLQILCAAIGPRDASRSLRRQCLGRTHRRRSVMSTLPNRAFDAWSRSSQGRTARRFSRASTTLSSRCSVSRRARGEHVFCALYDVRLGCSHQRAVLALGAWGAVSILGVLPSLPPCYDLDRSCRQAFDCHWCCVSTLVFASRRSATWSQQHCLSVAA